MNPTATKTTSVGHTSSISGNREVKKDRVKRRAAGKEKGGARGREKDRRIWGGKGERDKERGDSDKGGRERERGREWGDRQTDRQRLTQ